MPAQERLHALDAVRGFALLLGIVLHATMSFFIPIPAPDSSQSETLAVTFVVIHIFRMSLFFFIAGFFAHLMLERRGVQGFVRNRAQRMLVPMVGGWVILAPLTIGVVIWGAMRTYGPELPEPPEELGDGLPLLHLWFLYYLCLFYVLALVLRHGFETVAGARAGAVRSAVDAAVRLATRTHVAPLLLAAPVFAVVAFRSDWVGWLGIPTPDRGLAPQLQASVAYGTAFLAGWLVHRQVRLLEAWRRRWGIYLGMAVVLTLACLTLLAPNGAEPNAPSQWDSALGQPAFAAAYTLAIWCWTFAIIGAGLAFFARPNEAIRYLADASYYLYLAHLPVVFFLQVLLAPLAWHWSVKFPLILVVAMAVLLPSYHYLVRPTFIGQILNGRKHPRRRSAGAPRAPDPGTPRGGPAPRRLAVLENVTKRYGTTTALDGINLSLERGELLALLGPNGAGKTTAISLWLGLNEPDEGTVSLLGQSPLEVETRLGVGVMMQDVHMAPALTARELVALTASYYPAPMTVDEVLALTRTATLADKRYGTLSGGQKRQVQFAAAICGRPSVLFLDEPTVGLDVEARAMMWQAIRALLSRDCSIVLTTHYLEEAEALADRVAVLAAGRIAAAGTVDEMRSLVMRRHITCVSTLAAGDIKAWPGVVEAVNDGKVVEITAFEAEDVVRRLLAADPSLSQLQVRQASLAEAFTEITRQAA